MYKWTAIFRSKRDQKNESDVGGKEKKKEQSREKRGRGQGGKWMRQEETRGCKEVGGWSRVEGKGRRKGDSRGEEVNQFSE